MYQQIKRLADEALALQNKNVMDEALRRISAVCDQAAEQQPEQHGTAQAEQQPATTDANANTPEGGAQ